MWENWFAYPQQIPHTSLQLREKLCLSISSFIQKNYYYKISCFFNQLIEFECFKLGFIQHFFVIKIKMKCQYYSWYICNTMLFIYFSLCQVRSNFVLNNVIFISFYSWWLANGLFIRLQLIKLLVKYLQR